MTNERFNEIVDEVLNNNTIKYSKYIDYSEFARVLKDCIFDKDVAFIIHTLSTMEFLFADSRLKQHDYLQHIADRTRKVLIKKAGEYASNSDRLINFKDAARFCDKFTPLEYAFCFAMKHLTCIIEAWENNEQKSQEWIDEKYGDAINYCILIIALIEDGAA